MHGREAAYDGVADVRASLDAGLARSAGPIAERASAAALARARAAYDLAGRRSEVLGLDAFADPAWHMLLDLFLTESRGARLSVTALCIGSRASTSTALRYVGLLQEAGLISRVPDASDARRSHVSLTDAGWEAMNRLLDRGWPACPMCARELPCATR